MKDPGSKSESQSEQLRETILGVFGEVAAQSGKELVDGFGDDTLLLDSGLDSLDLAIVVARLEQALQDDPFTAMVDPIYPKTLGDFIAIYEQHFASR
jgi:hypothetical protein